MCPLIGGVFLQNALLCIYANALELKQVKEENEARVTIPETLSRDLSNKRTRITNPWHTCKRVLHTWWKNCAFAGEGSTIWNDDRVSSEIFVHWKLRLFGWLGWLRWWEAWKVGAGDASLSSSQNYMICFDSRVITYNSLQHTGSWKEPVCWQLF